MKVIITTSKISSPGGGGGGGCPRTGGGGGGEKVTPDRSEMVVGKFEICAITRRPDSRAGPTAIHVKNRNKSVFSLLFHRDILRAKNSGVSSDQ